MSGKSEEEKRSFVPRITQLDANEFDKEIRNVLFTQLMEVKKYLKPGALNNIKQEMNLVLDLLIFYYSVVMKNATFGQELLSLRYKPTLTKNQMPIYAILNYVLPYIKNKYEYYSSTLQSIPNPIRKSIDKLDVFISICSFLNALFFLKEGKYPNIVDRWLRLTTTPVNKINQPIGYNFMTRELLWHGFMELLMSVLPLINYKTIKRKMRQPFIRKSSGTKYEKSVIYNSETKCVICDDFPILPCKISIFCPHPACYYCVKSNHVADKQFVCPVCGETNTVEVKNSAKKLLLVNSLPGDSPAIISYKKKFGALLKIK